MTNVYGQDEDGDIETNNEISSQLGSQLVTNETVPLTNNQNDTSMLNTSEPGFGEFDNFTTPMLGNESFDTGNESLLTEEDGVEDDSLNENMTTETEMPNPLDNSSELALEDDGDALSQSQQELLRTSIKD